MNCTEFRLSAEDAPAGSASLRPTLNDHLRGCASCQRWESERERWGDLGALFREAAAGEAVSDALLLRSRVRATVSGMARPRPFWFQPAFGTMAAGSLIGLVLVGARLAGSGGQVPMLAEAPAPPAAERVPAPAAPPSLGAPAVPAPEARVAPTAPRSTGGRIAARDVAIKKTTPNAQVVGSAAREPIRVLRVGNQFGLEWPSDGDRVHTIARSSDPSNFLDGAVSVVRGDRWVDSGPAGEIPAGSVQFYRID